MHINNKSIDYAAIFNVSLTSEIRFSKQFKCNSQLIYSRGKDFNNVNLPLISPLSYSTAIAYSKEKFSTEILLQGSSAGKRTRVSAGYYYWAKELGNYSTYSDWNNFPRQGRNFFVNIIYSL